MSFFPHERVQSQTHVHNFDVHGSTVRVLATTDAALASVSKYMGPAPPVTYTVIAPVTEYVTPPKKLEECVEDIAQIIDVSVPLVLEELVEELPQEQTFERIGDQIINQYADASKCGKVR